MDTTNSLLVVVIGILIFQQFRLASFANDWTKEILQLSAIRTQLQDMRIAIKMESGMRLEEAQTFFPDEEFLHRKFGKPGVDEEKWYEEMDKFHDRCNYIARQYHLAWKRRHQESQKPLTSPQWWNEL